MAAHQIGSIIPIIQYSENSFTYSEYQWNIANIAAYHNKRIASPIFILSNNGKELKWLLKFKNSFLIMPCQGLISLYAKCLNNNFDRNFDKADVTIGIVENNTTIDIRSQIYKKECDERSFGVIATYEYLMNPINEILKDNILTIYCQIRLKEESNAGFPDIPNRQIKLRLEAFDDFENLLENNHDFSDVRISIDDKTIMAHKCILAQKSPVFDAMFRADMTECRNNAVQVEDIAYEVFIELLRFIYCGKVRKLEQFVIDLLEAAVRYQVEHLKNLCEIELARQLSVDSAVSILKLADKYDAKELKKNAIEYITKNKSSVFDQEEFRSLRAELFFEICQALK